jgi:malonate-semialdehyde dehydrogenase (acetylating)/methylmalonate-semialdehyde dehydrogenase
VGEAKSAFTQAMTEAAVSRTVGYGLNEGIEMGPVIRAESKARIESLIRTGVEEGAQLVVDGRNARISSYEQGYFLKPTILEDVTPGSQLAQTEIFGPVLGMMHVKDIDETITLVNRHHYGNMACLFTRSGAAARKFRYEAQVGNIGINVGVAAPMAFFPFCGWKESFFGDLHGQGRDAVEFYTEKKVVVERWPK